MMEVMNRLDLYQNFHTLISRQHISIQIPLDHKTLVFNLSTNLRKQLKWIEFSLDRLHLLFLHS